MEQGINFIDSAKNAPITIKPLAQFYGVAALLRALTLFLDPKTNLHNGHGLKVKNWEILNDRSKKRGFPSLVLEIKNGLYTDFATATKGKVYFRANSSKVNLPLQFDSKKTPTTISFSDIVSLLPDTWPEFEAWVEKKMTRHRVIQIDEIPGKDTQNLRIFLDNKPENNLGLLFPNSIVSTRQTATGYEITTNEDGHFQPVQLHRGAFNIGDLLLTPPIHTEFIFSTLEIFYIVSFT